MAVSSNPIVLENAKPGNPESEWDISGAGSSNIEVDPGFGTGRLVGAEPFPS